MELDLFSFYFSVISVKIRFRQFQGRHFVGQLTLKICKYIFNIYVQFLSPKLIDIFKGVRRKWSMLIYLYFYLGMQKINFNNMFMIIRRASFRKHIKTEAMLKLISQIVWLDMWNEKETRWKGIYKYFSVSLL